MVVNSDTIGLPRDPNGTAIQGTFQSMTDGTRVTVTTPGTAVQLTSTSTVCKMLIIQALFSNTHNIAVGGSGVLATVGSEKGITLNPGATYTIPVVDVSLIYIDAITGTEGVTYQYFV